MEAPLIIIGAGRSGTNALRDVLSSLDTFSTWPCDEINYVWRHGNRDHQTDEFTPEMATPAVGSYIQSVFARQARKEPKTTLVEKTCANSLRVGFVHAAVPAARFVHITRDARDVVSSAIPRWTAPLDIPYIARKARFVPPSDVPHYAARYLKSRLFRGKNDEKQLSSWGPRFADLDNLVNQRVPLHQICAHQWNACVRHSMRDFAEIDPSQWMDITYRDLVTDGVGVVRRIADFAERSVDDDQVRTATSSLHAGSLGAWQKRLTEEQVADINEICGPTQNELGYS